MKYSSLVFFGLVIAFCGSTSFGGPLTTAARETAEAVVRQFGKEAVEEGVEKFAIRLESLAAKYGDDALAAARKAGPRGVAAVEAAGKQAPLVAKILSREGDRALSLVDDAARMELVARYGDDAAEALIRHQGVAAPLIQQFDTVGAKALSQLDAQNARRLAILADEGTLGQIGRSRELLDVVGRYGNKAMDFIWRNKGALVATTALTAFLADPEGFLNGTRQLTEVIGEHVVAPATAAAAREIAPRVNWTLVLLGGLGILVVYSLAKYYLRQRLSFR